MDMPAELPRLTRRSASQARGGDAAARGAAAHRAPADSHGAPAQPPDAATTAASKATTAAAPPAAAKGRAAAGAAAPMPDASTAMGSSSAATLLPAWNPSPHRPAPRSLISEGDAADDTGLRNTIAYTLALLDTAGVTLEDVEEQVTGLAANMAADPAMRIRISSSLRVAKRNPAAAIRLIRTALDPAGTLTAPPVRPEPQQPSPPAPAPRTAAATPSTAALPAPAPQPHAPAAPGAPPAASPDTLITRIERHVATSMVTQAMLSIPTYVDSRKIPPEQLIFLLVSVFATILGAKATAALLAAPDLDVKLRAFTARLSTYITRESRSANLADRDVYLPFLLAAVPEHDTRNMDTLMHRNAMAILTACIRAGILPIDDGLDDCPLYVTVTTLGSVDGVNWRDFTKRRRTDAGVIFASLMEGATLADIPAAGHLDRAALLAAYAMPPPPERARLAAYVPPTRGSASAADPITLRTAHHHLAHGGQQRPRSHGRERSQPQQAPAPSGGPRHPHPRGADQPRLRPPPGEPARAVGSPDAHHQPADRLAGSAIHYAGPTTPHADSWKSPRARRQHTGDHEGPAHPRLVTLRIAHHHLAHGGQQRPRSHGRERSQPQQAPAPSGGPRHPHPRGADQPRLRPPPGEPARAVGSPDAHHQPADRLAGSDIQPADRLADLDIRRRHAAACRRRDARRRRNMRGHQPVIIKKHTKAGAAYLQRTATPQCLPLPRKEFYPQPRGAGQAPPPTLDDALAAALARAPHIPAATLRAAVDAARTVHRTGRADASLQLRIPATTGTLKLEGIRKLARHMADADYALRGAAHGFRTGYRMGPKSRPADNHRSAYDRPHLIDEHIRAGLAAGQLLDVTDIYDAEPDLPVIYNLMALKDEATKVRLIVDASFGKATSANAGADPRTHPRIKLATPAMLAADIIALKKAAPHRTVHLQCYDLQDAYKCCPVAPQDWWTTTIAWKGRLYWWTVAMWGHRAAGNPLCHLTTAMAQDLRERGFLARAYVDDFGVAHYADDSDAMHTAVCKLTTEVGTPISEKKLAKQGPPSARKTWIGLEFDCDSLEIRVPPDKLEEAKDLLHSLAQDPNPTPRLVKKAWGKLQFVSRAAYAIRPFLTALRLAASAADKRQPLPPLVRSDLAALGSMLDRYNGVSMFPVETLPTTCTIYTDASTSTGYGWWSPELGTHAMGAWSKAEKEAHINQLEAATVIAAVRQAVDKGHRAIAVHTDNMTTKAVLTASTTSSAPMYALLREYATTVTHAGATIIIHHVRGLDNTLADALSRGDEAAFRRARPTSTNIAMHPTWATIRAALAQTPTRAS